MISLSFQIWTLAQMHFEEMRQKQHAAARATLEAPLGNVFLLALELVFKLFLEKVHGHIFYKFHFIPH